MISFGAVEIDSGKTFYAELKPISEQWVPDALKVSGFSRSQTLNFADPSAVMKDFRDWIVAVADGDRIRMIADNAGFDWSFINYYFHAFVGENPLGWSCISLTSMYNGFERSMFKSFKGLRKTKHTHNALDDAKGNAEVIQFLRPKIKGL
jgi:DNA polymerase III epsilon subunit-like protein